jgi:hypothetical protein
MPFSKTFLQSYLGDELIQSVFNEHLKDITLAYETDLASGEIETGYTLTQYIEDYIVNDMGFNFNNDLDDQTDDMLYKRLGIRYRTLNHIYEQLIHYVNKRWPSFDIPSLPSLITRLTFWQPLETYIYNRINGNGDNQ